MFEAVVSGDFFIYFIIIIIQEMLTKYGDTMFSKSFFEDLENVDDEISHCHQSLIW